MYGICNLSVVPVRKEPDDRSELVTQLLFGEHFAIHEQHKQWRKIHIAHDEYEGWIDEKQMLEIAPKLFHQLGSVPLFVTTDLIQLSSLNTIFFPVLIGSILPLYDGEYFYLSEKKYTFQGNVKKCEMFSAEPHRIRDVDKKTIIENACMYLNAPYLWGGRTPFGIDCSGLTQMAYKLNGIKLNRDAHRQAEQGYTIALLSEAEPGDLAFFDNEEGKIIHTGIILSNNKIIHASGYVRIDNLDFHGIYNMEKQKYSHHLRLIKRIA